MSRLGVLAFGDSITNGGGDVLEDYDDKAATTQVVSSSTAEQLRSAMRTVVEKGTGTNALIDGVTVGGKTGTAQNGENNSKAPYAWFTSYAPVKHPKIVVAVMLVRAGAGGATAAPAARVVLDAATP